MLLCTLTTGDAVHRYERRIVVQFEQPRKVLSTAILNGGYREDMQAVFNYDCSTEDRTECILRAPTFEEHMRLETRDMGFDPDTVCGIGTAAQMKNAAIKTTNYENLTVTAIVTGGIEVNGGRVGDPASHFLPVDKSILPRPGTINIILIIDADLPPGILARTLVTCTEAKTAALQELMAGSNYSNGLATGSGTDQTIIVANPSSPLYFESAGKHSKLGELIGCAVKPAVQEALLRQTGLSPQMQHSVLRRLKRFGVNEDRLWREYLERNGNRGCCDDKAQFTERWSRLDKDPYLVTITSLYVHLLDQFLWKLLSAEECAAAGDQLLAAAAAKFGAPVTAVRGRELEDFIQAWVETLVQL